MAVSGKKPCLPPDESYAKTKHGSKAPKGAPIKKDTMPLKRKVGMS